MSRPHRYDVCKAMLKSLPPQHLAQCMCGAQTHLPASARQGDPWGEDCPIAEEEEAPPQPASQELPARLDAILVAARELADGIRGALPLAGNGDTGRTLDRAYAEVCRTVASLQRAAKGVA